MNPLADFATSVLADVLRRQPLSPGKVGLAWQMAAGTNLARVAEVTIAGETSAGLALAVRARDARWALEIERLQPMLIERLARLLGKRVTLSIA